MDTLALDCLRNVPTRMHPSPSCGDGVVDEGEQCDCGHAEVCDNPCCVAATCTLAAKASCASGSCCDIQTCRPKPPGVECRAAATDCDLPEFCSGHSEYCAKDVTKIDGDLCRGGHCFSGACGSREGRCRRVWGPSAAAASPDCSSKLNVRGTHAGNCGPESRGFRRCRQEESLCGTLHCIAPARPSRLLPDHRNGSARAGLHECHFISGSENYPAHHWLTPDGAQCGSGKVCASSSGVRGCRGPAGDCSGGCSGNGVCNSLDHCHCYAGYAPPNCSLPGLGGSVDRNVMSDVSGEKRTRQPIGEHPLVAAALDACCCPIMTKTARWMLTWILAEKKLMNRNIEVNEGENEDMLCSVDLEIKAPGETSSWGVAGREVVTELVTITPQGLT
ncbi:Disintegrin and metalloproteinase domain-containing protein 25 [Chionoecetes opilio]|uniref:Disintegrin and metalloproteinase domain-containing protein 25 n=1 Tax=Chionoecetes opilio TaxID=41210 RepID=A0A8J5BTN9_CHIOP|nr:Disintegrin and metalloproteinase domain-containing protein 25 [Chionoecetes opilio]